MTGDPSAASRLGAVAPRPGVRTAFVLMALAAVLAAAWFRHDAWSRAELPFLADGIEYLLMGRAPVTGEAMPVKPVRPGFLGLVLTVPFWLQQRLGPEGEPLGYSVGLAVPYLFWLLAALGAYRLGRNLAGPWAGLLAGLFVAVQPECVYWSSDFLADVPAAAAGVWAVAMWVERKPFRAGVFLGASVILRYQSLIPMAAFLMVPVVARQWRDLGRLLLGLVPPAAVLGVADAFYWGEPFHSFLLYVPRQLTTFLPVELVQKILPVEAVQGMATQEGSLAAIATKPRDWYLEEAPKFFTWWWIYPLYLYPVARRGLRSRAGADVAFWVGAVTFTVLSIQRYKETRYLLFVSPLAAALAAAGAVWAADLAARRLPRLGRAAAWVVPLTVLAIGVPFARRCVQIQGNLRYRPFGNVIAAVDTIPAEQEPFSVVLKQPWVMAADRSWEACTGNSWYTPDVRMLDLDLANPFFNAPPNRRRSFRFGPALENMDYFVVRPTYMARDVNRWRWLNDRTAFDAYFLDWNENLQGVVRLRNRGLADGPPPFWQAGEERARDAPARARFAAATEPAGLVLEWAGAEVTAVGGTGRAVRIDHRWRLPDLPQTTLMCETVVRGAAGQWLASFRDWILPEDPLERRQRAGGPLRTSAYGGMAAGPGDELLLQVRVVAVTRLDEGVLTETLRPDGPGATETPRGWILEAGATVLEPEAGPEPDRSLPRMDG